MERLKVKDVMNIVTPRASITQEYSSIVEIARKLVEDPRTHAIYVINKEKKLIGMITMGTILKYLYPEYIPSEYFQFDITPFQGSNLKASDIMLPPVFAKPQEPIEKAFEKMFEYKIWELPVVNDEMQVVGDINGLELIHGWLKKSHKK